MLQKIRIIFFLIILYSCNQNDDVIVDKEKINSTMKIYIPKTIFDTTQYFQTESDVMYDTISNYVYCNKNHAELCIEIISSENFKQYHVKQRFDKALGLLKLNYGNHLKINFSKYIDFGERDISLIDYSLIENSISQHKMKILCNSKSRNKQVTININYLDNMEYTKLIKDSIPIIISSIEIN